MTTTPFPHEGWEPDIALIYAQLDREAEAQRLQRDRREEQS